MGEIREIWDEERALYKERRAQRERRFREDILPLLCRYSPEDLGDKIVLSVEGSKIDVFPKADKILVRRTNKWIPRATRWIRQNLL